MPVRTDRPQPTRHQKFSQKYIRCQRAWMPVSMMSTPSRIGLKYSTATATSSGQK